MGHRRISPPQPPEILRSPRGTTIALHFRVASMLHEVLVDLFRRDPAIVVDLVRPHDDDPTAERIGTALWKALARAGTDLEHGDRYWDLFLSTINEATRRLLMLKFDDYAPQSEWGKRFYAEGLRRGHTEGRRQTLLLLLEARALAPNDDHREAITTCTDSAVLERWIRRAATATAPRDVFDSPSN